MKRTYFFLAPARSGSKWLATFLDSATPVTARHEYVLNHDFQAGRSPYKRTSADFARLASDRAERSKLIAAARAELDKLDRDYAEVNVYLETSLDLIREFFPESSLIFLHRDPRDVVRSLLSRDWYDTPVDPRHRRVDVPEWDESSQFARVCHYVADTDRRLLESCEHRLSFETALRDVATLAASLYALGIRVDPDRATLAHRQSINATTKHRFPPPADWTSEQKATFSCICGGISEQLGYAPDFGGPMRLDSATPRASIEDAEPLKVLAKGMPKPDRWRSSGMDPIPGADEARGITVVITKKNANVHVTLGGSSWNSNAPENASAGWPASRQAYVEGRISASIADSGVITVFLLGFGPDGTLVQKSAIGFLSRERRDTILAARPGPESVRFDIALYAGAATAPDLAVLERVDLRLAPLPPSYGAIA